MSGRRRIHIEIKEEKKKQQSRLPTYALETTEEIFRPIQDQDWRQPTSSDGCSACFVGSFQSIFFLLTLDRGIFGDCKVFFLRFGQHQLMWIKLDFLTRTEFLRLEEVDQRFFG